MAAIAATLLLSGLFFGLGYLAGRNDTNPSSVSAATTHLWLVEPPGSSGAISIEISTVERESEASAIADSLQELNLPVFIVLPRKDKFYHVEVGPYPNPEAAAIACRDLQAKRFACSMKSK